MFPVGGQTAFPTFRPVATDGTEEYCLTYGEKGSRTVLVASEPVTDNKLDWIEARRLGNETGHRSVHLPAVPPVTGVAVRGLIAPCGHRCRRLPSTV